MAYFVIEDFKLGLDGRRLPQAAPAGSLITLQNAAINRGGEIEKSKDWVKVYDLPPGQTFGLAALKTDLYVFGSVDDPGMPAQVTGIADVLYQKLEHEDSTPIMTAIINWDVFAGKLFTLAQYDNDDRRAFNDGTIVAGLLPGSGTDFAGLVLGDGLRTFKGKMYLCSGTNMLFSAVNDASKFDTSPGAGILDITLQVSEGADIVGFQRYQDSLAVASLNCASIWSVDPDPTKYNLVQVLENLSFIAARSIKAFGDHDVFGLTNTGIRSLRAINSALSAGVDDVGTPIDDIILAQLDTLTVDIIKIAVSTIEPRTGRYLLSIASNIYAFTYFAKSKISAWSILNPNVSFTDFVTISNRLYARAGNQIFLQGGPDNDQYTPNQVVVETPYLDARQISNWKEWNGIDLICTGVWQVFVNTNPNLPDYFVETSKIDMHTIDKAKIGMKQWGPVVKFKFVHQGSGPAVLSKIIVHYDKDPSGRQD